MKDPRPSDSAISKVINGGLSGIFLIKTLFTAFVFPASMTVLSFIKSSVIEKIITKVTGFVVAHRREIASFIKSIVDYLQLIFLTIFLMLAIHLALPEISRIALARGFGAAFAWFFVMAVLFLVAKQERQKYQKVLVTIIALLILIWFARMI